MTTRIQRRRSRRARSTLVVSLAALVGVALGSGGASLALWSDAEVFSGSVSSGYEYFAAGHVDDTAPATAGVASVIIGSQEAETLLEDHEVAVALQTDSLSQGNKGLHYQAAEPEDWGDNVFGAAEVTLFPVASVEECTPDIAADSSAELASTPVAPDYSDTDEPVTEYWCLVATLDKLPGEGSYANTGSVTATAPGGTTVTDSDTWKTSVTSDLDPGAEPDHQIEFRYDTFRAGEQLP